MTKAQEFDEYMKSLHDDFLGTPIIDEMKNKHHRCPRYHGGTGKTKGGRANINIVQAKKHMSWHILFGHMKPEQIAQEINENWIDPDYELVVRLKAP